MKYLLLLLFLFGCDQQTTKEDFDRTGRPQTITVHVYDTKTALTQSYVDRAGRGAMEHLGWSEWSENNESWGCEIHVLKTNMSTWGHELKHCMYGQFHGAD